jgi:hypothetical protein
VHDNTIVQTSRIAAGLGQDIGDVSYFAVKNNRWTNNTYIVGPVGAHPTPFSWNNQYLAEAQWRGYGHDTTGSFVR